jgi:hypothetical protein
MKHYQMTMNPEITELIVHRTKRAYDSKMDACRVFRKMLDSGNPPDAWEALLEASTGDFGALLEE